MADDALLRCALATTRLSGPDLEFFLTSVRHALLQSATKAAPVAVTSTGSETSAPALRK